MNILVLEDDPIRVEWFRQYFNGETLHITSNVVTAIRWLGKTEYERIYLGYGLLDWHTTNDTLCDKTTGLAVAKYIAETNCSPSSYIIIHSMHETGATQMSDVLKKENREHLLTPMDKLSHNKVKS